MSDPTRYVPDSKPTSGVAVGSSVAVGRVVGFGVYVGGVGDVGVGADVDATAEVGVVGTAVVWLSRSSEGETSVGTRTGVAVLVGVTVD